MLKKEKAKVLNKKYNTNRLKKSPQFNVELSSDRPWKNPTHQSCSRGQSQRSWTERSRYTHVVGLRTPFYAIAPLPAIAVDCSAGRWSSRSASVSRNALQDNIQQVLAIVLNCAPVKSHFQRHQVDISSFLCTRYGRYASERGYHAENVFRYQWQAQRRWKQDTLPDRCLRRYCKWKGTYILRRIIIFES